jgi:DHA1 family multidrug resistance protein-like MFS transporter
MLSRFVSSVTIPWQRTLIVMFVAQLVTSIGYSSIIPFLPLYVQSLGSTMHWDLQVLAGMVYSGTSMAMLIASPFWGTIADRHGRKLMVERALLGGAVVMLVMAFVRSAEQLVLVRVVQGFITGSIGATNALVTAIVPRQQTGYAMGVLQVGAGGGLAIGPLVGGVLADSYGYAAAFYVTSVLLLIAGILVLVGAEEKAISGVGNPAATVGFRAEWRHILAARGVKPTYLLRFLNQLPRMMIVPIAPLFVQTLLSDKGRINSYTGLIVGGAAVTTTLSAVSLGRLGDRIGHRRILIFGAAAAGLLYLPQTFATSTLQLLLLQGLVGLALGAVLPALGALLAGYTTSGEEGAVYGLDNSIYAGANVVAPLIAVGIALQLGLRATFAATSLVYFLVVVVAVWLLPHSRADCRYRAG